jgi:hypothetical protein
LQEARDCLLNVDITGAPVPSARFMGGREIAMLLGEEPATADEGTTSKSWEITAIRAMESNEMILPGCVAGVGPFPKGSGKPPLAPRFDRDARALAHLYTALVSDVSLDLIGSRDTLLIDGRFSQAPVFARALATLRPQSVVLVSRDDQGVARGALRLVHGAAAPCAALEQVFPLPADMTRYRAGWRDAAQRFIRLLRHHNKDSCMPSNPLLGVFFHWLGGLASASFYVPYKRVRGWAWEVYWLTGGMFSWVIGPWVFAGLRTEHLWRVLAATPHATLAWCWFWGMLWGFGGLTYGLAMRYLGMSLGMAIILGLTMVIGTIGPPLFHGTIAALASSGSGWITFAGIALAMGGVIIVAQAGRLKERELSTRSDAAAPAAAHEAVAPIVEYNFSRGILVALFSGVMSSCFAFGLDAGLPIRALTLAAGTPPLSQGLPVLCVVLAGGFTTNLIWCLYLL